MANPDEVLCRVKIKNAMQNARHKVHSALVELWSKSGQKDLRPVMIDTTDAEVDGLIKQMTPAKVANV